MAQFEKICEITCTYEIDGVSHKHAKRTVIADDSIFLMLGDLARKWGSEIVRDLDPDSIAVTIHAPTPRAR